MKNKGPFFENEEISIALYNPKRTEMMRGWREKSFKIMTTSLFQEK